MNFYKYYNEIQFDIAGYNICLDDYFLDFIGGYYGIFRCFR